MSIDARVVSMVVSSDGSGHQGMSCPQCEWMRKQISSIVQFLRNCNERSPITVTVQDSLRVLIDSAPSPLQSVITWIPVSERLPDADASVLIAYELSREVDVWIGFFDDPDNCWRFADGKRCDFGVTHWAELPPTPSEAQP